MTNGINGRLLSMVMPNSSYDYNSLPGLSMTTLFYGLVMGYHPDVKTSIEQIRRDLKITIIEYPQERSMQNLFQITYSIDSKVRQELSKAVLKLLKKYQLWDNWKLSLMVMVCTNILPIPEDNLPFLFHPVVNREEVEIRESARLTDITNFMQTETSNYLRRIGYPAIHFTERFDKPNQITNWIEKNWNNLIKPELLKLPPRKKKRADINRLATGLWLRSLIKNENKSWSEVEEIISKIEENEPDMFGNDLNRNTPNSVSGPDLVYSAEKTLTEFFPI